MKVVQRKGMGNATLGLAGWVLERLRASPRSDKRLTVLERVTLAPKHALVLIEAEGRKFLVATSPEGAPVFFPLNVDEAGESGEVAERPFSKAIAATLSHAGNR